MALSTVQRAIAADRISVEADGRIDPRRADREWRENTRERTPQHSGLREAQLELARCKALAAKSRFERLNARLVDAGEVRAATVRLAQAAAARLLRIPAEVAPLLMGLTDVADALEVLQREVHRACQDIAGAA